MLEMCCEEEEDKGKITTKKFELIFFSGPTNYGRHKKHPFPNNLTMPLHRLLV